LPRCICYAESARSLFQAEFIVTSDGTAAALLDADILFRKPGFELRTRFVLQAPWTVLFGPSGAGKTTLLRVIAGLAAPERGRVALHTRVLTDTERGISVAPGIGATQRRIGFVTQQAALFPHLSVRANVAFGLTSLAPAVREARVAEMLRVFGAGDLAERRPAALSGGERQRVALARAVAPGPELLLLDEPFAALDVAARAAMIEALRTSGVPVLYVSHDLADAWQTNADAIVLESGQVAAQGQARIVLAGYRSRVLAQLGAPTLSE
jgi:molybdate transport system ATP-binding protein